MYVIKRDGSRKPLDISQIRKQTIPATKGLFNVSYEELEQDLNVLCRDNINTVEIQDSLIDIALNKIDLECSDWTYVAARLKLYSVYHDVKRLYGVSGNGNVYDRVTLKMYLDYGVKAKRLDTFIDKYDDAKLQILNDVIDSKKDLLMSYLSVDTYFKRYAVKYDDRVIELPQHLHMRVAMALAQNEEDNLAWAIKFYNIFTSFEYINATPVNSNAGLLGGSTISCLIGTVPDSIEGIYDFLKEVAKGSQLGSGWGFDWTSVRSKGSYIDGVRGIAGGKLPFLKNYNDTAIAVDQRGVRPGAFAAYISTWDIDVFDFIDGKKASGEERLRIADLFLALNVDKVFIERDKNEQTYTLFDPYDVPDLIELHNEEFKVRYEEYEQEFLDNPKRFNPFTEVINAKDLMRKIVTSYNDEGQPFIHFIDNTNANHKHDKVFGKIKALNLCTEIAQHTDEDHTAVCNLGSVNIARVNSDEDIVRVVEIAARALDNGIDVTTYPSEKSKRTQLERRSVGLGVLGEAEYLANHKIHYGSEKHFEEIDRIYGLIATTIQRVSKELAIEKGSCVIEGERFAYMMAVAPNSTSGIFASTTNSHEAVFDLIWTEENGKSSIITTAPNLNAENYEYYVGAYNIDQQKSLRLTAARAKHIDMAISHNIYLKPEDLCASDIRSLIWLASDIGVPSLYYLRSEPPKNTLNVISKKNNKIACVGCEN